MAFSRLPDSYGAISVYNLRSLTGWPPRDTLGVAAAYEIRNFFVVGDVLPPPYSVLSNGWAWKTNKEAV